jgi:hypothetical protein
MDIRLLCEFYPDKDGVCDAGSEVSSANPCTKIDERNCQWAKRLKELMAEDEQYIDI